MTETQWVRAGAGRRTTADGFTERFRAARSTHARRQMSLLGLMGEVAGRLVNRWDGLRTNLLTLSGLGFVCWAAYDLTKPLGLLVIGLSLLVVEHLSGRAE